MLVSDKGVSRAAKQPLLTARNREQPSYLWDSESLKGVQKPIALVDNYYWILLLNWIKNILCVNLPSFVQSKLSHKLKTLFALIYFLFKSINSILSG